MGVTHFFFGIVFIPNFPGGLSLGKGGGREGSHPLSGGRHCSPMAVKPLGLRAGWWPFDRWVSGQTGVWNPNSSVGVVNEVWILYCMFGMNSLSCCDIRMSWVSVWNPNEFLIRT